MAEVRMQNLAAGGIMHLPGSWLHEMDGGRPLLAICGVGSGVVQGLAVVEHASGGSD